MVGHTAKELEKRCKTWASGTGAFTTKTSSSTTTTLQLPISGRPITQPIIALTPQLFTPLIAYPEVQQSSPPVRA